MEVVRSGTTSALGHVMLPQIHLRLPPPTPGKGFVPLAAGKFGCQHSTVSHLWELYLLKKATCSFFGAAQTNDRLMQGYKGLAL